MVGRWLALDAGAAEGRGMLIGELGLGYGEKRMENGE